MDTNIPLPIIPQTTVLKMDPIHPFTLPTRLLIDTAVTIDGITLGAHNKEAAEESNHEWNYEFLLGW